MAQRVQSLHCAVTAGRELRREHIAVIGDGLHQRGVQENKGGEGLFAADDGHGILHGENLQILKGRVGEQRQVIMLFPPDQLLHRVQMGRVFLLVL